jgi:hypothetical protein
MTALGMALSIGCGPPTSISSKDNFDEQMVALRKESIRVDNELDTATAAQGPVKTPQEAAAMLKIFENFCTASEDLYSRQNALYAREHKSLEPVRIEQHQALSAVCEISQICSVIWLTPRTNSIRLVVRHQSSVLVSIDKSNSPLTQPMQGWTKRTRHWRVNHDAATNGSIGEIIGSAGIPAHSNSYRYRLLESS